MGIERDGVYRIQVELVAGMDSVAVEMALTNLSDRNWKDTYVNNCCRLLNAPQTR